MDAKGRQPSSVCLLSTSLDYGGAEIQVAALANGLRARGWNVRLMSLVEPGALGQQLSATGIPVESLHMRRGVPDPRALAKLAYRLRQWRPDVLHCHMVHANLLGRAARLLAPVPAVICTVHSIVEGGRWLYKAYGWTSRLADLTTSVSEAARQRHIATGATPGEHIEVVANGVDTTRFRPDDALRRQTRKAMGWEHAFVWLAVGRLEAAKDWPNMLHAFAQLKHSPEVVLAIVGSGTLHDSIVRTIHSLGLEKQVQLLGNRTDVAALMNAADAYLMSSAWEGMPMVLLEAAATGLPVVATDVGGNRDVVKHGATGFLCKSQDSAALAEQMRVLMALSEAQRRAMGVHARAHVTAHYDLEHIIDRWESLYAELCGSKQVCRKGDQSEKNA